MADTTTNQKWVDAEEKRMEKRDARGSGSRMPMRCVCKQGGREVAT